MKLEWKAINKYSESVFCIANDSFHLYVDFVNHANYRVELFKYGYRLSVSDGLRFTTREEAIHWCEMMVATGAL